MEANHPLLSVLLNVSVADTSPPGGPNIKKVVLIMDFFTSIALPFALIAKKTTCVGRSPSVRFSLVWVFGVGVECRRHTEVGWCLEF